MYAPLLLEQMRVANELERNRRETVARHVREVDAVGRRRGRRSRH
jgi:hypothetical protein